MRYTKIKKSIIISNIKVPNEVLEAIEDEFGAAVMDVVYFYVIKRSKNAWIVALKHTPTDKYYILDFNSEILGPVSKIKALKYVKDWFGNSPESRKVKFID